MTEMGNERRASRTRSDRTRTVLTFIVEGFGILVQILLLNLGLTYLLADEDATTESLRLLLWCVIATLYLGGVVIWLNIDVRVNDRDAPLFQRVAAVPLLRWFSTIVTFSASLVGLAAATTVILTRNAPDENAQLHELVAVWAMLVAWAMFHWGYARIYHSHYLQRAEERPLRFPETEHPRLVDFVYFAYTNGTSFATSDVSVTTSRMRWTVVWHTSFSFFFNALIIVLTMNTIVDGFSFF